MKTSKSLKKKIIADRKAGVLTGMLSWKYDLTVSQIIKICDKESKLAMMSGIL